MAPRPTSLGFFRRPDNPRAAMWERRIRTWLARHAPDIRIVRNQPDLLIVLGGDGTILQAGRERVHRDTLVLGMNLGTVGFLASVRDERSFLTTLASVLAGRYRVVQRLMLELNVIRNGSSIAYTTALNEVYIQNPLGMVRIDVRMAGTRIQRIQGTGVLVATPTGSTGYNLSAHGPIVDPSLRCYIVTEILDHAVPTPSIVVPADRPVELTITGFRQRGLLALSKDRRPFDVLLACDGQSIIPLERSDRIIIEASDRTVNTIETEHGYFSRSLHQKFSIS